MQYLDKTGLARLWNIIKTKLSNKEDLSNKVTSITSTSTGNQYPSAKAVYNSTTNIYSTSEIKTNNVWIDGKPIYRKVISCGALPNSTSKLVNHNISDIDNSRIYGFAVRTSDKREFPLPFSGVYGSGNIQIDLTSTQIQITTDVDRSSFNESYIIVEYTKTTD